MQGHNIVAGDADDASTVARSKLDNLNQSENLMSSFGSGSYANDPGYVFKTLTKNAKFFGIERLDFKPDPQARRTFFII